MRRIAGVLLSLIVLGTAAAVIGAPAQSAGTYRVDAIFDTAKGIIPGQVVKIAGARVGSIEDVRLTEDYKARIVMSVPRRFAFREDASCTIQPEGLISENFVQCDPGTPGRPQLEGEPVPTVPVERTSVPVSITDLFKIFQADVRQRFTVAMVAVGGGLAARGDDLNAIIRRSNPALAAVRRLTRDLARQKEQISAAVRDTDRLIASLAERRDKVTDFIEQADRVAAQTADKRAPLAETIERLPRLLDATDLAIGDLNRLLRNGRPLLGELRAAAPGLEVLLGEVGPFSAAAGPALTALGEAAVTGRRTVADAAPLVSLLRRFTTVSGPVGRTLADVLVDLRDAGGVEYLARFVYFSAAATSRYDSTSHILPAHAVDGQRCAEIATEPVAGCNAFFREPGATRQATADPRLRRAGGGRPGEPALPVPEPGAPAAPGATPTPGALPDLGEGLAPLEDLQDRLPVPDTVDDLTDFLLGP
jgi:virulence factor Mce-like protein